MDAHDTPTTDTPDAATPEAADKPKKALAYTLVGGVIGFMVIALGVHLVQTNPAPASAAPRTPATDKWGAPIPTELAKGGQANEALIGALSSQDGPISTTLTCSNSAGILGIVRVYSAGKGEPLVAQWSNLTDQVRRGPTGLYVTMTTTNGTSWQLGQKYLGGTTYEQFSYDFSGNQNMPEVKGAPGWATFHHAYGWGSTPRFKAAITDTAKDIAACN